MMRHFVSRDHVAMPWANGRGQTVQMLRIDADDGGILLRLSMARVAENGLFSLFPGIERNLTVIAGPGFDLTGAVTLRADPLKPVAFAGDLPIAAAAVTAPSDDFNVMTSRALPLPVVWLAAGGTTPRYDTLCLFALAKAQVNGTALQPHDLVITDQVAKVDGNCLAVGITGLQFFAEKLALR